MNLFLKKILLLCGCFFVLSYTNGQTKFYATISPQEIDKDEYITYRIVIENANDIQQIIPPAFPNFIVLSGPSPESGISSGKGHTTQYISLVYILKPRKPGKQRINGAVAIIAGKKYKGNDLVLNVKNGFSGNSVPNTASTNPFSVFDPFAQEVQRPEFNDYIFHKGESVEEKVKKNMQLRLEVDKTSCYVGEPVVASYKLYTRLKSESKSTQNPTFSGFSVIDMQKPDILDYGTEKLNGREYNVYTLRKAQLYALQPGIISIESAELENNIQFIKEEYANKAGDASRMFQDFAGSLFPPDAMINQKVNLKSIPVDITVKPLPERGKPVFFSGAVGNFSITCYLQKSLFSTDESGKLSVTVSGSGNMQLLTAPDISWPAGIEVFEPKFTDSLVKTTVPVSGNKKFEYSFSANDTGHYVLPSIRFSFFDPATATYKIISTDSIFFQVSKGTGHPVSLAGSEEKNNKPSLLNSIFNHRWWILVFIAFIMITCLITWIIKEKKSPENILPSPLIKENDENINHAAEISAINQQNPFSESEICLYQNDCAGFYALMNTELKNYLSYKFSIDVNVINSNSIIAVMDKQGIENNIALKLQLLMQHIEWQLYTPFSMNEKTGELYQEALELVQALNSHNIKDL